MKCKTSLPLILTAKQMDTVEATMSPERLTIAKIVREGLCGKDDYFWAESPNE